jgi:hypothetical protein
MIAGMALLAVTITSPKRGSPCERLPAAGGQARPTTNAQKSACLVGPLTAAGAIFNST